MIRPITPLVRAAALALLLGLVGTGPGGAQAPRPGLSDYTVVIEARPIAGLTRNLSGLTYSDATGTLFAVVNRPAAIAELSRDGRLLRHLPLPAGWDAEGIAHVAGDRFVIADEAGNLLHWVRLQGGTVIHERSLRLRLGWHAWPNMGFEGGSWDRARAELVVSNEKWPRKVLRVTGLAAAPADLGSAGTAPVVTVREWWPVQRAGALGADLAGLAVDEAGDQLLLLSEESARITAYSHAGAFAGLLSLTAGNAGLRADVPQPEGLALGPDGSLYVVSEPNLFYRFSTRP